MKATTASISAIAHHFADYYNDIEVKVARVTSASNQAVHRLSSDRTSAKGLSEWQKKKIVRHIDQNIRTSLRIVDLGALVHLSASHFSRNFKVSFGASPYAYVLSRRVALAMALIQMTDEPLSQIACACGMCDQAHLCKSFRRAAGMTPQEWREKSRGPSSVKASQERQLEDVA
ncbi:helix-turn-helix domain-containing protein [Agrobacterium sp. DE0009]|uniref:helix-turn-helix domain-containing protein n=1 Tax=Agrobacterium sp. DE0009 TaxID=2587505 RepID=UPI00119E859A|nr:AraC family transcriptional regulator [Agrobacterium sp. DE0009]